MSLVGFATHSQARMCALAPACSCLCSCSVYSVAKVLRLGVRFGAITQLISSTLPDHDPRLFEDGVELTPAEVQGAGTSAADDGTAAVEPDAVVPPVMGDIRAFYNNHFIKRVEGGCLPPPPPGAWGMPVAASGAVKQIEQDVGRMRPGISYMYQPTCPVTLNGCVGSLFPNPLSPVWSTAAAAATGIVDFVRDLGRRPATEGSAAQQSSMAAVAGAGSPAGTCAEAVLLPQLQQQLACGDDSFSFAGWAPQGPASDVAAVTSPPAAAAAAAAPGAAGQRIGSAVKASVLRARHFDPNAAPAPATSAAMGTNAKGQQQPHIPSAAATTGGHASPGRAQQTAQQEALRQKLRQHDPAQV